MKNVMIAATLSLSIFSLAACGKHGGSANPVSNSPTTSAPTFDAATQAFGLVGLKPTTEGYLMWYGNMNLMQNIGDWNEAQFNVWVTNTSTNHIEKYVDDYPNSVVSLPTGQTKGQIIRVLQGFGSSVKFQVKVIRYQTTAYIPVTYQNPVFQWLPQGMFGIGPAPDYFVAGALPKADTTSNKRIGTLSLEEANHAFDTAVWIHPKTFKHCSVPDGATDCDAK